MVRARNSLGCGKLTCVVLSFLRCAAEGTYLHHDASTGLIWLYDETISSGTNLC